MLLGAALLLCSACVAAAMPDLMVIGVQMPAWVQHEDGEREPLALSAELSSKDHIYTGANARVLMRLADGSLVRLGENAVLGLDNLGQKKDRRNAGKILVTAALEVTSGAFRFTTDLIAKFKGERDVRVQIDSVTAGIRGPDVWGKADSGRNILCLIEGKIAVTRDKDNFVMNSPMTVLAAPKRGKTPPVAAVNPKQLQTWAAETEITSGAGAVRENGKWNVVLAQPPSQENAFGIYGLLRSAGYAAEISQATDNDGKPVYRVQISHLASREEATALAVKLKGKMNISEPFVSQL